MTTDEIMALAEKARFTLWPDSEEWAALRAAVERVIAENLQRGNVIGRISAHLLGRQNNVSDEDVVIAAAEVGRELQGARERAERAEQELRLLKGGGDGSELDEPLQPSDRAARPGADLSVHGAFMDGGGGQRQPRGAVQPDDKHPIAVLGGELRRRSRDTNTDAHARLGDDLRDRKPAATTHANNSIPIDAALRAAVEQLADAVIWVPVLRERAERAEQDAARYRWLTEDLSGSESYRRNALLERMAVMSKSAADAAIDAAMKEGKDG